MRLVHCPLLSFIAVLCFSSQSVFAQSCEADANTLCLLQGRFSVQLDWRDSDSNLLSLERVDQSGQALVIPRDDQTGFLALDSEERVDALVKVLDGRQINNSFWVFAAVVTAREYTLTVTDTMTEEVSQYFNPLGQLAPTITDTQAFPQTDGKRQALARSFPEPLHRPEITLTDRKGIACATDQGQICLGGDRFEVAVTWRDFQGNTGPGVGDACREA